MLHLFCMYRYIEKDDANSQKFLKLFYNFWWLYFDMFNSLLSTFFEIKKNYLFALYSTIVKLAIVKENNLLMFIGPKRRKTGLWTVSISVHHISEIKCQLNDTSVWKGSKSTQINNIPTWAKWIVFVIKLRLLLPCFGLTAFVLANSWPCPPARHHSTAVHKTCT